MPRYSLLTLFAVVAIAVMLFASEWLREVLCLLVTIALCVLFFQVFRRRAWKWTRDPSYVWQLKKKFMRPRLSLRALFVIVALFAACSAYFASQRRPVFSLRGPRSLPTAYFNNAAIHKELTTLLGPEYESTKQPSSLGTGQRHERDGGGYVSFDVGPDCEWYVRRFGEVGEVYVCVHSGKEEVATWVVGRRLIGPFVQSQDVRDESDRIERVLLQWMFSKMVTVGAEAEWLQRIANLLNAPVGYKRGGGVSSSRLGNLTYVSSIELPQKTVTDEQLGQLIEYLKEFPRLSSVVIGQTPPLSPAQQDKLKAALPNIDLVGVLWTTGSGGVEQIQKYPDKVYPETQGPER